MPPGCNHPRAGRGLADRSVDIAAAGHFVVPGSVFDYRTITGADLSLPMVETPIRTREARAGGSRNIPRGDATNLFLATMRALPLHGCSPPYARPGRREPSRNERHKARGLVVIMDLVRLRTAALTERYVNCLGHDYVQRGLPAFFDDFRN